MGKLATAAAATGITGTGAAGLYGAHHMGWLGGSTEASKPVDPKELPRTLTQFKKVDGGHCLQTTFPGIPKGKKISEQKSDLIQVKDKAGVKFGGGSNDVAKGCLVVNWDKEKGESGKMPNFRLLWTFAVGSKGFAVYLSGNFDDKYVDNPKMSLGGIAYLFNRNQEGNWEPTEQLKSKNGQLLKNNIRLYLPQHTIHVLPGDTRNTHWNFLETGTEQIKVDAQTTPFRKYWHWKQNKGSNNNVMSWSLNLPIWWFHCFDTKLWDMPEALADVEKGEWVEGVEEVVQAKPAQ